MTTGEAAGHDVVVRAYRQEDRERVREICHVTGYMGEPVDWLWRDRESFADVFSGYYTDEEPGSAHVVEIDGRVEGYLLGCLDSSRAWDAARVMTRHVLRRGIAFRPGTAGLIWRSVADIVRDRHAGRPSAADLDDDVERRFPAHLHIDLMPVARGRGAGTRLVRAWFDQLHREGHHGCHLRTFAQNAGGIAFFESIGFRKEGVPVVVPGWRSPNGGRLDVQTMVRDLDDAEGG